MALMCPKCGSPKGVIHNCEAQAKADQALREAVEQARAAGHLAPTPSPPTPYQRTCEACGSERATLRPELGVSGCDQCYADTVRHDAPPSPPGAAKEETFSQANRARCEAPNGFNHKLNSWSLSDWFTAVVGELGEAANVAKKLNRVRDGITGNKETADQLRTKLQSEVADAYIYLDLLAQSEGFDLMTAVIETFNRKSQEIGYPVMLPPTPPPATEDIRDWFNETLYEVENNPGMTLRLLAHRMNSMAEELGVKPIALPPEVLPPASADARGMVEFEGLLDGYACRIEDMRDELEEKGEVSAAKVEALRAARSALLSFIAASEAAREKAEQKARNWLGRFGLLSDQLTQAESQVTAERLRAERAEAVLTKVEAELKGMAVAQRPTERLTWGANPTEWGDGRDDGVMAALLVVTKALRGRPHAG